MNETELKKRTKALGLPARKGIDARPGRAETGEITASMVASRETLSAGDRKSSIANRKSGS